MVAEVESRCRQCDLSEEGWSSHRLPRYPRELLQLHSALQPLLQTANHRELNHCVRYLVAAGASPHNGICCCITHISKSTKRVRGCLDGSRALHHAWRSSLWVHQLLGAVEPCARLEVEMEAPVANHERRRVVSLGCDLGTDAACQSD